MPQNAVIIDAATRFLRTNPEAFELASRGAGETGVAIEALLADAVRRLRASGFQAISEEQVVSRPPHRVQRRTPERVVVRRPPLDQPRPRVIAVTPGDAWRDGEEQLVDRPSSHELA